MMCVHLYVYLKLFMQGNWEEVNNNYDMCSLIFIPKAFDGLIISFVVVEI